MPIDLICLDADDTLWHNMRHFQATQDALVAMLEPFADAGIASAALEACEVRNLKLYGYGAKAFTLSMIETALELGGDDVPGVGHSPDSRCRAGASRPSGRTARRD